MSDDSTDRDQFLFPDAPDHYDEAQRTAYFEGARRAFGITRDLGAHAAGVLPGGDDPPDSDGSETTCPECDGTDLLVIDGTEAGYYCGDCDDTVSIGGVA